MNGEKLRAWWSHRQGLDGSLAAATAAEVLDRSGWARSVGGVGPYLTLWARASIGREAADAAVANLEIHELPAARGCTYVVPAGDFALALKVGQSFAQTPLKVAAKLGVTEKEIDKLGAAVVKALGKGPLDPDGIRAAVGNVARSLGEEGKKKGIGTTLPLALGVLQAQGEIRRVPTNGRLDQQRYQYALWRPNPLEDDRLSEAEALVELAARFFRWVGPATAAEFQWYSASGVKAAKAALTELDLAPVEDGSDRLLLADDLKAFKAFKPPAKPQYSLVSSLDAISAARRDVRGLVSDEDLKHPLLADLKLEKTGGLSDLPNHAILDRGRLVGLWEYDPETESIAWASFGAIDKALLKAIDAAESFIKRDLGDARSFSLDSPKSRAPRIAALRKLEARG
jgi:hypothetical protein